MRIVYVLSGTLMSDGSIKSFLNLLWQVLADGNDVMVVTPSQKGVYEHLMRKNVKVVSLPYYFNISPNNLKKRIKSLIKDPLSYYSSIRLLQICKRFNPDIIHSNTSVNDIGYRVAKWMRIPHIWHIREYGDKDFSINIRHIDERLKENLNYSIAITKDIARHRNVYGLKSNRVIYNGIMPRKEMMPTDDKGDYFLYAGRIELNKGVEDCVNAFIEFKLSTHNHIRLLIAGKALSEWEELQKRLMQKAESANVANSIEWLGNRSDIDVLMKKAIATIVPSHFEGFGRVMPEAMSEGCLVIGRNTGGTHEQFENGLELMHKEIGLRFDTTDELTDILKAVTENGVDSYSEMIKAGFETVNQLYSNEKNGRNTLKFYDDILTIG